MPGGGAGSSPFDNRRCPSCLPASPELRLSIRCPEAAGRGRGTPSGRLRSQHFLRRHRAPLSRGWAIPNSCDPSSAAGRPRERGLSNGPGRGRGGTGRLINRQPLWTCPGGGKQPAPALATRRGLSQPQRSGGACRITPGRYRPARGPGSREILQWGDAALPPGWPFPNSCDPSAACGWPQEARPNRGIWTRHTQRRGPYQVISSSGQGKGR
jgi:hypothetical protein